MDSRRLDASLKSLCINLCGYWAADVPGSGQPSRESEFRLCITAFSVASALAQHHLHAPRGGRCSLAEAEWACTCRGVTAFVINNFMASVFDQDGKLRAGGVLLLMG